MLAQQLGHGRQDRLAARCQRSLAILELDAVEHLHRIALQAHAWAAILAGLWIARPDELGTGVLGVEDLIAIGVAGRRTAIARRLGVTHPRLIHTGILAIQDLVAVTVGRRTAV